MAVVQRHDLVDEWQWSTGTIDPSVRGVGKRVDGEGTRLAAFTVREARCSPRGVIVVSYVRRRAPNQQVPAEPDLDPSCGIPTSHTGRDDHATGEEVHHAA